jgi:hypothetical protein
MVDDEVENEEDEVGEAADAAAKKKKKKKKKKKAGEGAADGNDLHDESPANEAKPAAPPAPPAPEPEPVPLAESEPLQAAPAAAPEPADTGEGNEDPDEGMSASKKKREKAKAAAARKKAAGGGTDSIADGGGGSGVTTAAAAPSGPTEDAHARFQALLDALKEGREAPVAQLARCGLGDKKLRMLASAVRTRGAQCAIQTLDLAHNVVSDAGAAQLCAALTAEGRLAPRLTLLSLVGNPLGDVGAELCAKMLEERPEVALVLPELSQPPAGSTGGAGENARTARAVDTYFACRSAGDVPPAWQGPPAQGADGRV